MFASWQVALVAFCAFLDDALQALLAQVVLELVSVELDRARFAPIADKPDTRRVEAKKAGRVHAVASENGLLTRRSSDHELLDSLAAPRDRIAGEPFADAQVDADSLVDPGSYVDGSIQKSCAESGRADGSSRAAANGFGFDSKRAS